jgi:hypothetical protein
MSSTLVTREGAVTLSDRASLAAVVAGGLVAVAVGSLLHLLGLAIGASTVNAVAGASPGAGTAVLLYGAWLMLTMLISMAAGAYVAGRLADTANPMTAGLHGLAVWAAALLLGAVMALGAIGGVVNLAGRTAGAVAGTAATSAAAVAGGAGGMAAQAIDPARAADRIRDALTAPADPRAMTTEQATAELARMAASRVADGQWSQADRDRAAILTARVAGITEQEAAQRITAMETQARETAARAEAASREAADAAARGTAIAAFWMFASLLLGAAAAVFAGRMGARRPVVVDATGTTVLGLPATA